MKWPENASQFHTFIKDVVSPTPLELAFPDLHGSSLTAQTGVGLFMSETHKWGMASSATSECRAKEQKAEHVIKSIAPPV